MSSRDSESQPAEGGAAQAGAAREGFPSRLPVGGDSGETRSAGPMA